MIDAIIRERIFRLLWLAGMMVLDVCSVLPLLLSQKAMVLLLIFLVLAFELHNCAIEKMCDSTGRDFSLEKKYAKDFASAGVMLLSFGAACVFITYIIELDPALLVEHIPEWAVLTMMALLCLPICLQQDLRPHNAWLFFASIIPTGIFLSMSHDWLSFLGGMFHVVMAISIRRLKTQQKDVAVA